MREVAVNMVYLAFRMGQIGRAVCAMLFSVQQDILPACYLDEEDMCIE